MRHSQKNKGHLALQEIISRQKNIQVIQQSLNQLLTKSSKEIPLTAKQQENKKLAFEAQQLLNEIRQLKQSKSQNYRSKINQLKKQICQLKYKKQKEQDHICEQIANITQQHQQTLTQCAHIYSQQKQFLQTRLKKNIKLISDLQNYYNIKYQNLGCNLKIKGVRQLERNTSRLNKSVTSRNSYSQFNRSSTQKHTIKAQIKQLINGLTCKYK